MDEISGNRSRRGPFERIALTHQHEDHAGGAGADRVAAARPPGGDGMVGGPPGAPGARLGQAVGALAVALAAASLLAAAAPAGEATVVLAARSIGSRRGDPLDRRSHAALLVRLDGRPGGFIVQGGKEPAPGSLFGARHRVVGWAIPAEDPPQEFARAAGGFWGEPGARELPTREIARFAVKGLTEARLRALVDSINQEFQGRDYRLESGPSSNSFVSRLLDRLGIPLPPLGGVELPGWGWRP